MTMYNNIRHNPFICFFITIGNCLRGRIHFSKEYKGKTLRMDDGQMFTIFRHVSLKESMKALIKKYAEPGLWLDEVPVPEPGINDVLIKIQKTSICGTDVHIYNWDD